MGGPGSGRPKKGHKGAPSKTHPGDKDYSTKKGDKDFHEGGKDVKKKRAPYKKGGTAEHMKMMRDKKKK